MSMLVLTATGVACSDDESVATASVSGDAFNFTGGMIAGAAVWVLEDPTMTVTTDASGHFEIEELEVGGDVTLRMTMPDYAKIQTGTLVLDAKGAQKVTFQAPTDLVYAALAAIVGVTPDPGRCQMVSTVTRIGKSIYDKVAHGEAGVTVTVSPALSGIAPVYFNEQVLPDRKLTRTTADGGVLFTNVPPGTYTLTASKTGVKFKQVRMKCEAGWLVNASPPWGLQAYR